MSPEYLLQLVSAEYWLQFAQEHWVQIAPYLALFLLTIIPSVCLLHRTGMHIALTAFNLIPIGGTIVLLWVIAFSKWPSRQLTASMRADGRKGQERMTAVLRIRMRILLLLGLVSGLPRPWQHARPSPG